MSEIKITRPGEEELAQMGIDSWSPWECEPGTFDWEYAEKETAYIFEGKVNVTTPSGKVEVRGGDLVEFPEGLKCTWDVVEKIRKVYKFG